MVLLTEMGGIRRAGLGERENCILYILRLKCLWNQGEMLHQFLFGHVASAILVPWPGIEPVSPAVEVWSPNHWIAREVPQGEMLSTQWAIQIWNSEEISSL